MARLILVRHAQPLVVPSMPAHRWHLSDAGRAGAERVADALVEYAPSLIVTSPEPKARETAAPLAGRMGLHVVEEPGLREHMRGNEPYLNDAARWQAKIERFFAEPDRRTLGTETAREALARCDAAVRSLFVRHPDADIVAVSHASVMSLWLESAGYGSAIEIWRRLGMPAIAVVARPSLVVETFVERV